MSDRDLTEGEGQPGTLTEGEGQPGTLTEGECQPGNVPADGELYRRFLDGDRDSYDQLLIRHGDSLTMYLYGYLHDWDDAEDLMIEAFARIMAKRPSIGERSFKAYLLRTARNLAIRFSERKRLVTVFSIDGMSQELADTILTTGRTKPTDGASGGAPPVIAEGSPVEDELIKDEKKQILHVCLDRIDPELREALWLVYFEDMSYAQAASVMGVSTKKVDHLLERGKKTMRGELEKEGMTSADK